MRAAEKRGMAVPAVEDFDAPAGRGVIRTFGMAVRRERLGLRAVQRRAGDVARGQRSARRVRR